MKRILAIVTITAILSLMLTALVFAEDYTDVPQWFKDMMSWRKAQVDQAEKSGTITEEQAELYKDRIDQMEKYHNENGFSFGMGTGGFGGGCGFGGGMMNGYRYPVQ